MKKVSRVAAYLFVFMALTIPVASLADNGLVPCDNVTTKCDFNQLMTLVNTVIKFILFDLAIPIAAIMFVYAGIKLVFSGGSTEGRDVAKRIFTNAALGLVIAAAGWLIIRTLLSIMGYNGAWIGF